MGAVDHPYNDFDIEAERQRLEDDRNGLNQPVAAYQEADAFYELDESFYGLELDESYYEDKFDGLKTPVHFDDDEIEEMEERYERRLEDEELSLAWENSDKTVALLAFWDAFQDHEFPINGHGKRARVRH